MAVKFPAKVGNIKILTTYRGKPHTRGPLASHSSLIRLCPEGNPEIHVSKKLRMAAYSYVRQHLPTNSRGYYCFGESEVGRAFVARIGYAQWRAFRFQGDEEFLGSLEPNTVKNVEEEIRGRAKRIGNLWILPLPTNWVQLPAWAREKFGWDLVVRSHEEGEHGRFFPLLGNRSGWLIRQGGYCRPWHKGGDMVAVAGGRIFSPEFRQWLHLHGPHLVGLSYGWTYL